VILLSGVLALWNYHPAPVTVQICNKDNASALCAYRRPAHRDNNPTSGTTLYLVFNKKAQDTFYSRFWY